MTKQARSLTETSNRSPGALRMRQMRDVVNVGFAATCLKFAKPTLTPWSPAVFWIACVVTSPAPSRERSAGSSTICSACDASCDHRRKVSRAIRTGSKNKNNEVTETRYTREFADEVCRRMAEGASLREICRDHEIAESSVRQWVRDNRDNFAVRYQTARVLQVEAWSDLIIEIGNRDDLDPKERRV